MTTVWLLQLPWAARREPWLMSPRKTLHKEHLA